MKAARPTFFRVFLSTFTLSAFTFGGGYVIVPLMKKKFCDELHWVEEQEVLNLVAIAQSAPGAMAVNASILLGYRVAGVPGMAAAVAGTILPPLITLSLVSLFYDAFRSNPWVAALLTAMRAGVAAVIADVVFTMARGIAREKNPYPVVLMVLAFVAASFLKIGVLILLPVFGLLGWLGAAAKRREAKA